VQTPLESNRYKSKIFISITSYRYSTKSSIISLFLEQALTSSSKKDFSTILLLCLKLVLLHSPSLIIPRVSIYTGLPLPILLIIFISVKQYNPSFYHIRILFIRYPRPYRRSAFKIQAPLALHLSSLAFLRTL